MVAKPWVVIPLVLPVGEKEYTIQPVEYDVGLTLVKLFQAAGTAEDQEMFRLVMGPVWEEMIADRCPYPVVFRAGMAATDYQASLIGGLDSADAVASAERIWESGISPEAVAAVLAAANPSSTATPRSNSTDTARKTRSPARTRTTTSRKATQPEKAAPAFTGANSPTGGS